MTHLERLEEEVSSWPQIAVALHRRLERNLNGDNLLPKAFPNCGNMHPPVGGNFFCCQQTELG